jgi:hypothetical protein
MSRHLYRLLPPVLAKRLVWRKDGLRVAIEAILDRQDEIEACGDDPKVGRMAVFAARRTLDPILGLQQQDALRNAAIETLTTLRQQMRDNADAFSGGAAVIGAILNAVRSLPPDACSTGKRCDHHLDPDEMAELVYSRHGKRNGNDKLAVAIAARTLLHEAIAEARASGAELSEQDIVQLRERMNVRLLFLLASESRSPLGDKPDI